MVDGTFRGTDLTVDEAAARLGVTPQRVRALIRGGDLDAERMGARQYLVDAESVERRAAAAPRGGRRLSASDAWGVVALAAGGDATWLVRRSRYRLRQLLELRGLAELRSRLVARAAVVRLRAHPSELKALKSDDAIVLSGPSAASDQRLGLLADDVVDGYVPESDHDRLVGRHHLKPSRQPNVVLRVVATPAWPSNRRYAPLSAVALDLLEDSDPRSQEIGRELLERVEGEWRKQRSGSRRPRTQRSRSGA